MGNFVLSLFEGSLAQITFFSIFLAGMVFTLFSLIFGGDGESDFDHDADHGGDHGADGAHGPGMLSIRGASLMMVGFGVGLSWGGCLLRLHRGCPVFQ